MSSKIKPAAWQLLLLAWVFGFGMLSVRAEEQGQSIELVPLHPSATPQSTGSTPTYPVNASITKVLPPAMYGTWSIASTLISTDAPPHAFPEVLHHIWTLEVSNGEVILQNPASRAITQVNVEEVHGNTATFHHTAKSESGRVNVKETVTLTVHDDSVTGEEQAEYIILRGGVPTKSYILNLRIEGTRLTAAKVIFRPLDRPENYFEIEPLQHED